MEAFDPIVVKIKGDAGDLIATLLAAKKAMAEFADTAKKTNDKVKTDFDGSKKSVDDFSRLITASMRDDKSALESLRLKSTDLRTEIARLRTEFARTGNKSTFGDLTRAESDFKKINDYIKSMVPNLGRVDQSTKTLEKSASDTNDIFSIFADQLGFLASKGPAIGALVVALAPLLGGVAGGTVLSLLAGGGLAAGIVSQLGSSQVQSALQTFGQEVGSAWMKGTEGFQSQVAAAIETLGQFLGPALGNLGEAFAHMAPFLTGLASALGGSLEDFAGNLAIDFGQMGPIFTALERSIPVIVTGITEFFGDIADQAPAIASDIETIAHGFETVANVGGHAIAILAAEMAGIHADYQLMTGDFAGFVGTLHDALGGASPVTTFGSWNQIEHQLGATTDSLAGSYAHLAAEMKRTFDEAMQLDTSQVQMYASINDLKDALKANGDEWRITTRAGEANRLQLLQTIGTVEQYYTNAAQSSGVTSQLTAAYKAQVDALIAMAKQAGLSKDQVALLKSQFDSLVTVMSKANGKTITIPVHVQWQTEQPPASIAALIGRKSRSHANSGVYDPSAAHYDRSGIYPGRAGGYYMGEASTGREALIGEYTDPGRAYGAIVTAAGWHGLAVAPARGGTTTGADRGAFSGSGGGGGVAMADVYLDADKVGYAMLRWNGQIAQRSNVTLAGHPPGTTVGQLR